MSRVKKKKDPIVFILDLIIVAMSFALIIIGIFLWAERSRAKKYETFMQDASRMTYDLKKNDYASLIQGKYVNEINGYTETKSYHCLADYAEVSVLYRIYAKSGDEEKAVQLKDRMNSLREEMGSLSVYANQVDAMFKAYD